MTNLCKLRDDHSRLTGIVRRLGAVIERRAPPPPQLFALRQELSLALIGHLKAEDWLLYPALLGSADQRVAAAARLFQDEMGGLATAYRLHCQEWDAIAIAEDWAGYCKACRRILDALTVRITREDRELFPLLQGQAQAA